jgi:autotransporter-associated beta strand protein
MIRTNSFLLAAFLAAVAWPATAQTTLYRNALAPAQNLWAATAGWSVSGTASKAAPTTVGATDTFVFSNFWTPQQASGLAIWLDAADPNTVVGTGFNAVTQWNDKSGNGRNAVSATNGRPSYDQSLHSRNGNNVLHFNIDSMQAPFLTNPTALTHFMVYQRLGSGTSLEGLDFLLDIGVEFEAPNNGRRFQLVASPSVFGSGMLVGTLAGVSAQPADDNWNLHASTGVFTTGSQSSSYAITGAVVGTTTGTGANRTGTATAYRIGAGDTWATSNENSSFRANAYIAETLTYSAALSTADRELVEGYLAWKWGTVSSLPANHPYKSAAPTAASDTVYLGGDQTAAGLQFATGATTLSGGATDGAAANSLTLGSGGLTVSAAAGATTLGAASGATVSMVLSDSQTWTNDSGSLLRAYNGIARAAGDATSRVFTVSGPGNTQLDGVIADGGASGTLGLTKGGAGLLTLSGSSTYTGATTVSEGTLLVAGALGNTAVSVGDLGRFGGTGSLAGNLSFAATSILEVVNLADPLTVTGTANFASGFGIDNLAGMDWDALLLDTPYTVLETTQPFTATDIGNFGFANRMSVGSSGRQAYFESGSLQVIVVPEPGTLALAGLGLAASAWAARRRQ